MPVFSRLSYAWRTLFRKSVVERELDEELRAALDGIEPVEDAMTDVQLEVEVMEQ
jgi:hypothetical protein